MGCVAFVIFVILFCLRQPRDQSCLKQGELYVYIKDMQFLGSLFSVTLGIYDYIS